ncbi:hypothetical protein LG649_05935 [Tamlana sp. PT2-4]|uniref:Uncharacterized protein n=1 Tax=Neotamlana laminarinivorans TaxID=2883124 RepID=A0A9X1L146_9FLAO|nr:hypothetical protein [Tamlana laminarinivorans]
MNLICFYLHNYPRFYCSYFL